MFILCTLAIPPFYFLDFSGRGLLQRVASIFSTAAHTMEPPFVKPTPPELLLYAAVARLEWTWRARVVRYYWLPNINFLQLKYLHMYTHHIATSCRGCCFFRLLRRQHPESKFLQARCCSRVEYHAAWVCSGFLCLLFGVWLFDDTTEGSRIDLVGDFRNFGL